MDKVTPAFAASFLKTSSLKSGLPRLLSQSELKTKERLKALLVFCANEEKVGLPLLLTQDGVLRVFKGKVFSSKFSDLVPQNLNFFLHRSLRSVSSTFRDFVAEFLLDNLFRLRISGKALENKDWILLFSKFVSDQMAKEKLVPETVAAKIPDWKVLPVEKPGSTDLLAMKDAKLAVHLSPIDSKQEKMADVLKRLNCWQLNPQFLGLSPFCSTLTDLEGLSRILTTLDFNLLGHFDHYTILAHFDDEAPNLSDVCIERLKTLPLYQTYDGEKVSLDNGNFRVLDSNIPKEGLAATRERVTFLKHYPSLSKLYARVGLVKMGELEVYLDYVLDTLEDMEGPTLLKHLSNLQQKLKDPTDNVLYGRIVGRLRNLQVIGPKGNRKCASNFHCHKVELFKSLLRPGDFLPVEYRGDDLYSLCGMIGLRCKITEDFILSFATTLAKRADEEKAKSLVSFLFKDLKLWSFNFLKTLSTIKFIPAHRVGADLQNLHVQFKDGDLICFNDSVPSRFHHLVWTSASLLPDWAYFPNKKLHLTLKPDIHPNLSKVLLHCRTLCNHLYARKSSGAMSVVNSAKSCATLTEVMKSIYRFLMKYNIKVTDLIDVPCIVVEEGRKLIFPDRMCIEMSDNDLRPHLYKLPLELGEFHSLFCELGATTKPTLKQFADVLSDVHDATKGRKLSPEERRLSIAAVYRFFAGLDSNKSDLNNIGALFYLTKDGFLENLNRVTFSDRPKFVDRVKDYDCQDPATYNLDLKVLQNLPEKLRPKFLSDLVIEKLDPTLSERCDHHNPSCYLKRRFDLFLSDLHFRQGMTRLCKHVCSKSSVEFDETEMRRKLNQIGSICIECRPRLQTVLFNSQKSENIPGSEKPRTEFVDENGRVFVQHQNESVYDLAELISASIVQILGKYVSCGDGEKIVQNILNLDDAAKIDHKLSEKNITMEPNVPSENANREPGDRIEDDLLCLLTQDPSCDFEGGELVGYLQNGDYVLARIVSSESGTTSGDFNFGKMYKVKLGQDLV